MPVAIPLANPFAENGLFSKMYWQNGRPSTSGRKPKYELDYGA